VAELREFAASKLGQPTRSLGLELHRARSSRKRATPSANRTVKQYFTAPKVLAGLFKIIETLFDV
jgi:oligopeptidase A